MLFSAAALPHTAATWPFLAATHVACDVQVSAVFTPDLCTPERISNLMARFSADFVATCCESWTPHDICQVLPRLKLKMARKVGARGHSPH